MLWVGWGLRLGLIFSFFVVTSCAFTKPITTTVNQNGKVSSPEISGGPLGMSGGLFDDIQKFFSGFGSDDGKDGNNDGNSGNRIATIPVQSIKPGGLRLFLMFYLLGMQNTPDRNAWKADQPTREEYIIDYYFHDRTAMLTIELSESEITIDRIGAVPSNNYVMQEAVILEGILDELQQCAFDESIDEENRLLQLSEPKDAIEQARAALSFG